MLDYCDMCHFNSKQYLRFLSHPKALRIQVLLVYAVCENLFLRWELSKIVFRRGEDFFTIEIYFIGLIDGVLEMTKQLIHN